MLSLIDRLLVERPALSVLVTTGTVTSARLLATRLPPGRAWHQYVPVDRPPMCGAFSTIGGPIWRCGSNPSCGPT